MHILKLFFYNKDLFIKGSYLSYFIIKFPGLELYNLGLIRASEGFADFLNSITY
jgi:hypothetical protein